VKKIGLLSDTHSYLDERIFDYFKSCDEIWHAGDIGDIRIVDQLSDFKTFRAVYGNIDNQNIRKLFPKTDRFMCEKVDVLITHIGGYPGNYDRNIRDTIMNNPPRLFISGHSHICKVMNDPKLKLLHINPGAAGKNGFHQVRTIVRFSIHNDSISDLEVIELGKRF
jgi:uncharacterized protein